MMSVDTTLQQREAKGDPIRVGWWERERLAAPSPCNWERGTGHAAGGNRHRTPAHAERAFREAGVQEWKRAGLLVMPKRRSLVATGVADDPSV